MKAQAKQYGHIGKHWCILLFAFFALSPCVVKGSYLKSIGIEYVKGANKNKLTLSASEECSKISPLVLTYSPVAKAFVTPLLPTTLSFDAEVGSAYWRSKCTTTLFNPHLNTPPIYILFKQLKFDMC